MKLFSAKDAKNTVKESKSDNLNYQRSFILDRIKAAALFGNSFLVIDYDRLSLDESDYKFFEDLGYNVKRHEIKDLGSRSVFYFPIISWNK